MDYLLYCAASAERGKVLEGQPVKWKLSVVGSKRKGEGDDV